MGRALEDISTEIHQFHLIWKY